MNSELIRKDFPILETKVNGHPVVYFDNGATTQRPLPVMRAVMDYVTRNNGNPHRGAHIFAMSASEAYDTSKTVIKDFIGAKSEKEIIYTRNTSESLNLVARSYGETHLKKGDRILIPVSEHHSNLVPWQRAAKKTGAVLEYMYVDKETGRLPEEELKSNGSMGIEDDKLSFKQTVKLLFENKYFSMICVIYILQQLRAAMVNVGIFFMTYVLLNKNFEQPFYQLKYRSHN